MKPWLVIPLVLLLLQHADSQNMDVGNALPCGEDNLSCLNIIDPDDTNDCLTRAQLCDGISDCTGGLDEGTVDASSLACTGQIRQDPRGELLCSPSESVQLEALCDGFNNCTNGDDETSFICENKCRLPYYGGCEFTRECLSSELEQSCGICLPGLTPDLMAGSLFEGPCIPAVFLTLDASSYGTAESVPSVEVCVSGSVDPVIDLSDIAGENFVVNLTLSDGTALGGATEDYEWTSSSAVLTLTFDSTNLLQPQCFNITINDDELVEIEEMFSVSLTAPNNPRGQILLQTSFASVSITDNDLATFSLTPTTYMVNEDGGNAMVVVEHSGGELTFDIEVFFETVEAGSTATAGADYNATTVTLTFGAGSMAGTTQTVNVSIIPDSEIEPDETVNITIFGQSDAVVIGAGTGTITIISVDDPMCPSPVDIVNGMVAFTGNSIGDNATYICNSSFELIGMATTTCTQVNASSAEFQPMPPSCRPLCVDPVDIDNGNVTFTGNSDGDTATYFCNSEFELIGGNTTTCTQVDVNSTVFQPTPPSCRPLCPGPVDIDSGMVAFTGNSVGNTATYSCDPGFELIGNASTVTCTQVDANSAVFLPEAPECIPDEDCDSDPCDPNADCTELPGSDNFICTCIPPFQGSGFSCICPPSAGDDPHFSIMLLTGQMLCYTVQGEHDFAFNLISNEKVQMNAIFLPDSHRPEVTWMGSIGITALNTGYKKSNGTSLRFTAKENKVYIGDKVVLHARTIEKLTFTNGKLTISEAPPVEGFKYPEVLVDLHDASLSFSIKFMNEHLDIFWHSIGVQTVNSHGLIGQFFRKGIEIDEVRKILIMPNKEPVPVMRRPVWSFMEREMKDDQLCWTAMNPGYQGEGLIDGTYFNYLVNDVLSTEFKFKKQQ